MPEIETVESLIKPEAANYVNEWIQARELRNRVFGVSISDGEWRSCGKNWMEPASIEWLREKAKREIVV